MVCLLSNLVTLSWNVTSSLVVRVNPPGPMPYKAQVPDWKLGKFSGPTLGMPSFCAQPAFAVGGAMVLLRRSKPNRSSFISVGLKVW